ncbi:sulfotransferase [Winogradskyella undariae]|uniref:sulfotransferase n=1 Tax=Winogradskyella undariae TaxID=1285465 RepID=UPI00156AC904|nr:sulfotransferase [Winogradskyella undariae]NRR91017.1 sulfotransferase [Winogradskyella undariae]
MKNNILLIVGMHRSGTSLVSQWINACGLNLGDELHAASQYNIKGYYEDLDFLNFHKKVLNEINSDPSGHESLDKIDNIILKDDHLDEIRGIISEKSLKREQWGWKEPRTCLFLKYYLEIIDNPKFLVVYRDVTSVVNSLMKRQQKIPVMRKGRNFLLNYICNRPKKREYIKDYNHYVAVWVEYNIQILKRLRGNENVVFVNYNKLIDADELVFQKLTEWGFNLNKVKFSTIFKAGLMNNFKNENYLLTKKNKKAVIEINKQFNELT